jgi:hypothetical protein
MLWILDVARSENGLASGVLYPPPRLLRIIVFIEISNENIGAFARKGDRNGTA